MIDAPLAYAFTAGAVATVNPCGFAMLPAYLSYFLGIEAAKGAEEDRRASVGTALLVGAAVSAGFLVVFGIVGTLVNAGVSSFIDYVKWATIAIGIGLVVLGIAMLRGLPPPLLDPTARQGRTEPHARLDLPLRCVVRDRVDLVHAADLPRRRLRHPLAHELRVGPRYLRRLRHGDGDGARVADDRPRPREAVVRALACVTRCATSTGSRARCSSSPACTSSTTGCSTSRPTTRAPPGRARSRSSRTSRPRIADNIQSWGAGRVAVVLAVVIGASAWYASLAVATRPAGSGCSTSCSPTRASRRSSSCVRRSGSWRTTVAHSRRSPMSSPPRPRRQAGASLYAVGATA